MRSHEPGSVRLTTGGHPTGSESDEKRTRFTLTNVLEAENTAARNGAGWDVCLAALDARARGERFDGPHAGADAPWKGVYQGYIAAGVPSGVPVPGLDA